MVSNASQIAGDANAIAIQFTAIIVSGATSDAEHLL